MYSISEMKDLKMFRSLIMKVDHVGTLPFSFIRHSI